MNTKSLHRNENREGHDVDVFIIQKVQDTVIHLEVDEAQWEITRGSKRQAERTGFLAQYLSGLRRTKMLLIHRLSYGPALTRNTEEKPNVQWYYRSDNGDLFIF